MNTDFHNAVMVLPETEVRGALTGRDGVITDIIDAPSSGSSGVDINGDYLLPGLVELHTDNVERHVIPRPKTFWPNSLAAAVAHDAEMAASGVTTVFDSIRVGAIPHEDKPQNKLFMELQQAIHHGQHSGAFRIDHRLHFRCELTDPNIMDALEPAVDAPLLGLVSLMDHTPGQRQWRDLDALRRHNSRSQRPAEEIEAMIQERIAMGHKYVPNNRQKVLDRFRSHEGLVLASHDDTTEQHVLDGVRDGVHISEFPCSLKASKTAKEQGLYTLAGAPNVVRGGSHSGNVSAIELLDAGVLDGLSSDYVPASLLQSVFMIAAHTGWDLPKAVSLVTRNNAAMAKLDDRGSIEVGLRADLVHVALIDGTPIVRGVYVAGKRVS